VLELRRARELDPLDPLLAAWFGDLHWIVGKYDEALVAAREALELDPNHPWAYLTLGLGLAGKGLFDEAIVAHKRAAELVPERRAILAQTYAKAGLEREARDIAAELAKSSDRNPFLLAALYASLGDQDEALRWIEATIEARHPFAPWLFRWVDVVGPLHGHRRYEALRVRMGLPSSQ
jgi:tetratricopeptide (TPR) repeat protein